jgi:excisionase family DNA binding protein
MQMAHRTDQEGERRLLDVPAAAAYLAVSPRFMRRLVAERRVSFVKLGRHVRFDVEDLDRFVESGRVEAAGA